MNTIPYLSSCASKDFSKDIVLVRIDLNIAAGDMHLRKGGVPLRVTAVIPTIQFLLDRGAKVVLLSHRGRPTSPVHDARAPEFSLRPFAPILSRLLRRPVEMRTIKSLRAHALSHAAGKGAVVLAENLRLHKEEEKNDARFAKRLASIGTQYVNDAFGVSHRKDASVAAITRFLPSYAGLLLEKEMRMLSAVMGCPKHPFVFVVGGAKTSDKIGLIHNFMRKADYFLLGGGIANTCFAAQGLPVGDSMYEPHMISAAQSLLLAPTMRLPLDTRVRDRKILDIGERTSTLYGTILGRAKTIVWNGPMGCIEEVRYRRGSIAIARAILRAKAFSVVGGGETTALFELAARTGSLPNRIFLSTGGGAMLEYLAGKRLPGIEALRHPRIRAREYSGA